MELRPVPLDRAEGKILAHNIAGMDGRRALRKGKLLTGDDVIVLREIGRTVVYVADLAPDDVGEDRAARRLAGAVAGHGLRISGSASGRVNHLAATQGVLRIDVEGLAKINECEGITLATLPAHAPVRARQIVSTVKIIPFALPESTLRTAEQVAADHRSLICVDELTPRAVGLILSGSSAVRDRLFKDFEPLQQRVVDLGSHIGFTDFVATEGDQGEAGLANALIRQRQLGARLIILAGETAIMDRHDIAPRAVEQAGGRIECLGAPVDPGNLLMLAYLGDVPVLGAPGCARSRKINVVDWVLPRLLVGERLRRSDIAVLGHGGLLEDTRERPMPRAHREDHLPEEGL